MRLDTSEWQTFALVDYFDIRPGVYHYPSEYEDGNTPYVSASNENNGIASYIDLPPDFEGNCITTGKVGCTAFYQPNDFCATSDVNIIRPKFKMSHLTGLFLVCIINFNENYRWDYGRQCRAGDTKEITLKLPADSSGEPDWQWMEDYIRSLHSKPITTANRGGLSSHTLGARPWGRFQIQDLFEVKKGKRLTSEQQTEGMTPYIGAIDSNNGVANYIGQEPIHRGNTISLSYNGSIAEAFYQPKPFWATDDVNVLYLRSERGTLSPLTGLFVCAILRREKYRYSYGRKWTKEVMENTVIQLPVADDGKPDWEWMEDYMCSLPYGDRVAETETL